MLDYLKIKKKLIGYDNFLGMERKNKKNSFIGDIKLIKYIIRFFKLDNIEIIKDDMMLLQRNMVKFPSFRLFMLIAIFTKLQKIYQNYFQKN